MQKLLLLLPLLAITFLGYIGGAIVARFDLPSYGYLEELFAAVEVSLQPGDVVTAPWTVGANHWSREICKMRRCATARSA